MLTIWRQNCGEVLSVGVVGDAPRVPRAVELPAEPEDGVGGTVFDQGLGEDGEVLVVGAGGPLGERPARTTREDGDPEHEAVPGVAPLVEHPVLGAARAVHAVPAARAQQVVRGEHGMGPGDRGEIGEGPGITRAGEVAEHGRLGGVRARRWPSSAGCPAAAGALAGALAGAWVGTLAASLVGVAERREGPVVLVGHKWVVVLVVLVVLGGTVMVVGGCGNRRRWAGPGPAAHGAAGRAAPTGSNWPGGRWGDGATSTESMATTAVAVTSGCGHDLGGGMADHATPFVPDAVTRW